MAGLQEYKCPCCGGAIAFDSKIQKMKCPYCDTEFEMDALKGYDAELQNEQTDDMEWDTSAGSEWQEGETDGLRTYVCVNPVEARLLETPTWQQHPVHSVIIQL